MSKETDKILKELILLNKFPTRFMTKTNIHKYKYLPRWKPSSYSDHPKNSFELVTLVSRYLLNSILRKYLLYRFIKHALLTIAKRRRPSKGWLFVVGFANYQGLRLDKVNFSELISEIRRLYRFYHGPYGPFAGVPNI